MKMLHHMTAAEMTDFPTTTHRYVMATRLMMATACVFLVAFFHALMWEHNHENALEFAEMWLWFLTGVLGFNVAQYGVKRATDRQTKVEVAQAKASGAAPTVVAGNVGNVEAAAPLTSERPAPEPRKPTEPNLYTDDERGE